MDKKLTRDEWYELDDQMNLAEELLNAGWEESTTYFHIFSRIRRESAPVSL